MNLNKFLNELNAFQKSEENPRVILANGTEVISVDYNNGEHTIVIYTMDDLDIPVEEKKMEVFGLREDVIINVNIK